MVPTSLASLFLSCKKQSEYSRVKLVPHLFNWRLPYHKQINSLEQVRHCAWVVLYSTNFHPRTATPLFWLNHMMPTYIYIHCWIPISWGQYDVKRMLIGHSMVFSTWSCEERERRGSSHILSKYSVKLWVEKIRQRKWPIKLWVRWCCCF